MNRWLAGHVVWPLTERMLHRDTMSRFNALMASDQAAPEVIASIQNEKLRRLLELVDANCPFYHERFRDAGLDAHEPNLTRQALSALPPLDRSDVRAHLAEMSWQNCPGGPSRLYSTGGSSGEPLQFYIDRCRQSADWAARWRARSWWNLSPGDREIMVWAGPSASSASDRLRKWRDALLNQSILNAFDMSEQTMAAYVHCIRRRRPAMLYGYASSLALLARHMLARGTARPANRLRAVFVTGESLQPADARDIQAAFDAPVVIEYGSRDCGMIAGACPAGNLHATDENLIVEVLNAAGQPAAPGEVGEIVVTCLEAFATPLIRYRVGDLALVSPDRSGRCSCGRSTTSLVEIRGRVTDQIVCRRSDGVRRMHALSLIYELREIPSVHQFRITQRSLRELDVELVADAGFNEATEQSIIAGLRRRMGSDVVVHVYRRERIAPIASGKHACVLSEVNQEELVAWN